ncbi:hypothetical protein HPB47_005655 [Ixodes persulcatus]|uniref:Uncharacterized protein n=1 Tax=Ixodes persulcatus TaxID=34615 RepID=A0AC60PDB2_IXOPE|nr:hypothetical protein HPB47_005655 [Ixodes persulcatus]
MAEPLPPDDEELASVSGSIADDNQGAFQDVVRGTKRRCPSQGFGSSEKTIITHTEPNVGLVVLFTPVDGVVRIGSIDSVRLTSTLETLVPSCVIEVRYNRRKNLLAIDTPNGPTTCSLLGQTTLCGMKVRAFEPRGKASSVGIVRDIDSTLSDSAILGVLRSTVGIHNVRRIGKSTTIRVEFASPTLPEHVYVGLVWQGVDLYVNNPIQCHRCAEAATEMVILTEKVNGYDVILDDARRNNLLQTNKTRHHRLSPKPRSQWTQSLRLRKHLSLSPPARTTGDKATKQRCKTSPRRRHHQFRPDLYSRPLKLL